VVQFLGSTTFPPSAEQTIAADWLRGSYELLHAALHEVALQCVNARDFSCALEEFWRLGEEMFAGWALKPLCRQVFDPVLREAVFDVTTKIKDELARLQLVATVDAESEPAFATAVEAITTEFNRLPWLISQLVESAKREAAEEIRREEIGVMKDEPTIECHGGNCYSFQGQPSASRSQNQHLVIQLFLNNRSYLKGSQIRSLTGVLNPSRTVDELATLFPGAVERRRTNDNGYFIRAKMHADAIKQAEEPVRTRVKIS